MLAAGQNVIAADTPIRLATVLFNCSQYYLAVENLIITFFKITLALKTKIPTQSKT